MIVKYFLSTFILVFVLSSDLHADQYSCSNYKDEFPKGDFQKYAIEFFSLTSAEFSPEEKTEWQKLRGYENPYVSLASAYFFAREGQISDAFFSVEFASYLFHDMHKLCSSDIFREFSTIVKVEILRQLNTEVGVQAWTKTLPITKQSSSNSLRVFDEYYCAISQFDITEPETFEECKI